MIILVLRIRSAVRRVVMMVFNGMFTDTTVLATPEPAGNASISYGGATNLRSNANGPRLA